MRKYYSLLCLRKSCRRPRRCRDAIDQSRSGQRRRDPGTTMKYNRKRVSEMEQIHLFSPHPRFVVLPATLTTDNISALASPS